MKRTLAAILSITVTGCSFVMVSGPGNVGNPPQVYPDCSDSMTWPIVDGILSASFLLSGIGVVGATHDESSSTEKGGTAGAISAVLFAAAFGAGAYIGYGRVSKCKETREAFIAAHPNGMQPTGYVPMGPAVGTQNGYCTQQNTCNPGLVCAGMPDHTNRCMPDQTQPAIGTQGGACTAQLTCNVGLVCAGMPDRTNKCMPAQVQPAAPAVGAQGGACTPQLTCNQGLICAGMPDRTNKCMPMPAPGAQGGACLANNACNDGLVCAGMADHSNRCMPKQ